MQKEVVPDGSGQFIDTELDQQLAGRALRRTGQSGFGFFHQKPGNDFGHTAPQRRCFKDSAPIAPQSDSKTVPPNVLQIDASVGTGQPLAVLRQSFH